MYHIQLRKVIQAINKGAIHLEPGVQTLDGEQALALARTRKQDSDIQRGERQQEILKAILKKATTAGAVTKYTDVMECRGRQYDNESSILTIERIH